MQNATQPDMDKLISGGQQRRRRRNLTRAGGAALAVVLLGVVAYAVTRRDSIDADPTGSADTPSDTSAPSTDEVPPTLSLDGGNLEPGTYRLLVGADTTGAAIEADLTVDGEGWESGNFPVAETGGIHGGLAVYEPLAIAAGTGCSGDTPNADLGETPQSLAEQLAQLPQAQSCSPSRLPMRMATAPSTCGCGLPTTAPRARPTASPRRRGQSRHQLQPHSRDGRLGLLGAGPGRRIRRGRGLAPERRLGGPGGPDRPSHGLDHLRHRQLVAVGSTGSGPTGRRGVVPCRDVVEAAGPWPPSR